MAASACRAGFHHVDLGTERALRPAPVRGRPRPFMNTGRVGFLPAHALSADAAWSGRNARAPLDADLGVGAPTKSGFKPAVRSLHGNGAGPRLDRQQAIEAEDLLEPRGRVQQRCLAAWPSDHLQADGAAI